ncbi:MAG: hypothetical protein LBI43_02730 [Streptococcaceae bacterium]|jgi:uncharacterized membrane-anchored protein|nr:hypothetical protein [Streptococcaceae bacterium]
MQTKHTIQTAQAPQNTHSGKLFSASKVPLIGGLFWGLKMISTGQGESLSDFSSQIFGQAHQTMGDIFTVGWALALFVVFLLFQLRSEKYRPIFYWLTVALLAVFGTIASDGLTLAFGLSHLWTTLIFAGAMGISFLVWHKTTGDLSIHHITSLKAELSYWVTVLFSFALGTAWGDWFADTKGGYNPDPFGLGLGVLGTGLILGVIFLALLAYRYFVKPRENSTSEIVTFWLAYILTRPVGASFADYFGYDWHNGILGNQGMTAIWIPLFAFVLVVTIVKLRKQNSEKIS